MKLYNYLKDYFTLLTKTNYILICSYPKTGSTIFRMRLTSLLNEENLITHHRVNELSPEIGQGNLKKYSFRNQVIIIKTHHLIFKKILKPKFSISIFREPLETMCSHFEYYNRINDSERARGDINKFIKSRFGVRWYMKHLKHAVKNKKSIKEINLNYDRYIKSPEKIHKIIFEKMGITYNIDFLTKVLQETSRENLANLENQKENDKINNFSKKKDYSTLKKIISQKSLKQLKDAQDFYDRIEYLE